MVICVFAGKRYSRSICFNGQRTKTELESKVLGMETDPKIQMIIDGILFPEIPEYEIRLNVSSGDDILAEIHHAIVDCTAHGGGRIVIPPGVFRCNGPIHLESHIELHFSEGAFVKFSPDPELYLPAVRTRWEGVEIWN